MSDNVERDSWLAYSKHVINALERLDKQLDALRGDLSRTNLDIANLSALKTSLIEVDNKLLNLKRDIASQEDEFKNAVLSLEKDDDINLKRVDDQLSALNKKIDDLQEFMMRTKTIAWVVGGIVTAIIGMFSMSLKDLLK